MTQNVILENRTKWPPRMLVLNLDIQVASVRVENRTVVEGKDGKRRTKISTKSVPDSIRIPADGKSLPLPKKILSCREVKAAINAREIRVKNHVEKVAEPTPKKFSAKAGK